MNACIDRELFIVGDFVVQTAKSNTACPAPTALFTTLFKLCPSDVDIKAFHHKLWPTANFNVTCRRR